MKTIVLEIIFHVTFIFNLTKCKKKTQIEMYVIRESKKSNVNYAFKKKKEIPAVYIKKKKKKTTFRFFSQKKRTKCSFRKCRSSQLQRLIDIGNALNSLQIIFS